MRETLAPVFDGLIRRAPGKRAAGHSISAERFPMTVSKDISVLRVLGPGLWGARGARGAGGAPHIRAACARNTIPSPWFGAFGFSRSRPARRVRLRHRAALFGRSRMSDVRPEDVLELERPTDGTFIARGGAEAP